MATFLLCTDGTHGDVLPFIRLAQGLAGRGHETVVYSHQVYADTAARVGVRLVATDTTEAYDRLLDDHREVLLNVLTRVEHVVDFYHRNGIFDQIQGEYEAMAALARDRPSGEVVLVGRHTSRLSVLLGREALRVPAAWVCVTPTQHMGAPLTQRLYPRGLADPMNALRHRLGLPPVADWGSWLSGVDGSVCLWPDWFDTAGHPAPADAARVGFLLNDAAEGGVLPAEVAALVAPDVPADDRPVLITGGSSRMLHRDWYATAVAAVAASGRRGIVVCRYRDLLPPDLPAGVRWFPALPFATLMPAVAAVVHHGGILTSARAIRSGTPQVVLAHGVDRPDNAFRLRRLGLAEWLPAARWDPAEVSALLNRVLTDPGYRRRAADLAPTIDGSAALDAACRALEELVGRPVQPAGHAGPAAVDTASPGSAAAGMVPLRSVSADGAGVGYAPAEANARLAGLSPQRAELLRRWLDRQSGAAPTAPTH